MSLQPDIPEGFPQYDDPEKASKFHDAAYDAYITGKCFATMAMHIGKKASPPISNLAVNSKLLTPFINKYVICVSTFHQSQSKVDFVLMLLADQIGMITLFDLFRH